MTTKKELSVLEIEAVDMELEKAAAIVELMARSSEDNEQDHKMLKSAAWAVLGILESSRDMLQNKAA